jgi:hypothetical protein
MVPARAVARFDDAAAGWVWQPGISTLRAGPSSRDLRLTATIELR